LDKRPVIRWFCGESHARRVFDSIARSTASLIAWAPHSKQHRRRAWVAFFFVSSVEVAEPLLDLSHDYVDLEWLQKVRFLFELCTPFLQDRVYSRLLMIAFINNLLDGHFPFLKTHRLFLLEFGIARFDRRDEGVGSHNRVQSHSISGSQSSHAQK